MKTMKAMKARALPKKKPAKKDDDRKKDDDYEKEIRETDFARLYESRLKELSFAAAGEKDDDKSSDDDKKKDDGFEWTMEDLLPRGHGSDDHEKKDDDKRPDDDMSDALSESDPLAEMKRKWFRDDKKKDDDSKRLYAGQLGRCL